MMKRLLNVVGASVILTLLSNTASAQQVFVANLSSAQEVPTNASTGKGVATLTLNAEETEINFMLVTYSGLSSSAMTGHVHGPGSVGLNAGVLFFLSVTIGTSGTAILGDRAITSEQLQQLRSGQAYVDIHTTSNPNGEIRGQLKIADQFGDFDGDGRADIGVFRPGDSVFYILNSLNNSVTTQPWGHSGDSAEVQSDFDGDGRTDIGVVRDVSGILNWYILRSSNSTLIALGFGQGGVNRDITQAADYDGDGKADFAVFRPSNGTFYVVRSKNNGLTVQQWGNSMDVPVCGDFDKDGKADFAIMRDAGGILTWYIRQSSNGAQMAVHWGISGDKVLGLRADVDLDGRSDIVVWRPSDGTFYIRQSSNGQMRAVQFGQNGDITRAVDVDGDGKADFVAIRNVSGSFVWYILQSSNGAIRVVQWGITGDEAV